MRVKVYKNLHKKCYSISHDGKVIGHSNSFSLYDCVFRVQKAGRQKVLEKQQKNVHAYVQGDLMWYIDLDGNYHCVSDENIYDDITFTRVFSYDPYKYDYFYDVVDDGRIDQALFVTKPKDMPCVLYSN